MKYMRSMTAIILSFILLFSTSLPVFASGTEEDTVVIRESFINPLYEDIISEPELMPVRVLWAARSEEDTYFSDIQNAGAYLREAMTRRQQTIVIPYKTNGYSGDPETIRLLLRQIAEEALVHTGVPYEGDYLMWQFGGWNANAEASVSGDIYYWTFTYTYTYYTTAEEEALVDDAVAQLLEELDVSDRSPYRKVRAIYDHICNYVVYDRDHMNDASYVHQFTAYAALIDGKAVCQGYALLFYRLALELGVDCRLISGRSRGQAHGWNIAELDGLYYNLDTTWDAGEAVYTCFLRAPANFTGHDRDEEYNDRSFHASYPMASADYIPDRFDSCDHSYDMTVTDPTCLEDGYTTYHCGACGHSYVDDVIEAMGHHWDEGQITMLPTDTEPGTRSYSCQNCTATKTETIPATENVYRIFGDDRYQTAIKAADTLKQIHGFEKFPVILVASGTNFADALSGSYLAGKHDAPLLLVNRYSIDRVAAYIRENLAEDGLVYLLGGPSAVPVEMETALDGLRYRRLEGRDRYETNLAILREAGIGEEDILVCTGLDFADSLSASALDRPILLVRNGLNESQKEFLYSLNGNDLYIIGGSNAVSDEVAEALAYFGDTFRIEGADRYETSTALASAFSPACRQVVIAYGHDFPDGLCGGVLAAAINVPLILTRDRSMVYAVSFTEERDIRSGVVLGGSGLVSDDTVRAIFAMDEDKEMIVR